MVSLRQLVLLAVSSCSAVVNSLSIGGQRYTIAESEKRQALQDLVTWDEYSLFVRGERIFFYSAEVHPWRLPVPDLWKDVLQKIKALGYTGVSFYVDWVLHEGEPGSFSAEGVFDWEPFFEAAKEVGLYLLARPGPYINAEVSGGGFPGWLSRIPDILRTNETGFLEATQNYVSNIGKIIADAQITNGGPVIAFQAENEYTFGADWVEWPDVTYIDAVNKQFRDTGIVVPFINNEAAAIGLFVPGEPGGPDIYGHDNYGVGWDCAHPANWTSADLRTDFRHLHLEQSPNTPYTIPEFQGGAIDSWGGPGLEGCAEMVNHEAERIFYKNNFANAVTIFNVYMSYGGTNWGNLGQSGGYTSYDYGAAIKEDRTITREKYHEAKLLAQFMVSSPAYLEVTTGNLTNSTYVSTSAISTTPLFGKKTNFYVVRHSDYKSFTSTPYTFTVPTSAGNVTIPQLGGTLTLNGRDSKIHVTDYDVSGVNLMYSSADIYTHSKSGSKRVLLIYGLLGETHELAFSTKLGVPRVEGGSVRIERKRSLQVVQWEVTAERKVLHYRNGLDVYLLWRNDALNYWSLELESPPPIGNYSSQSKETVIAKAGYLLREVTRSGRDLHFRGDLNATAELEVVSGASHRTEISFNGEKLSDPKSKHGRLSATLEYTAPKFELPSLPSLEWKSLDSLPEFKPGYDDSAWVVADHTTTNNTVRDPDSGTEFELKTPTSLIASDYGFHTGSLIFRGHFAATGDESSLYLSITGGLSFGHSVWLGGTHLGSWAGNSTARSYNQTLSLPEDLDLEAGEEYVITVVIDHMGMETNWTPGYDMAKTPRGIMNYSLSSHEQSDITWKLTGNLGGEQYQDKTRGPLNEGGFFAERQGYHLPQPPTKDWKASSPLDGLDHPGVAFYTTSFDLNIPTGYDVPLSFVLTNSTNSAGEATECRAQLYVNGWQFGKYINHLGPQVKFPVPEGILDYGGTNYIAVSLWAQEAEGAKLGGLELVADAAVQSAYRKPKLGWNDVWEEREGAY
ncbi:Beta-galactosidase A [Fulvia fulva]|uniref:Beta-galactosidase n=1 Tax=Passalora fulva TaxID=5499 RepID=A0A9Q8LF02_PASFU|nr:Beta-galactosidase A [Fulvia fulva]UJO16167.1 Beta-galactosidase A [Fulvia fulva]